MQLKQSQVDYETTKLENQRMKEDIDELQVALDEMTRLKEIFEKNLEEALQSLQQERELKHALKKELDQRIKAQSMFSLQNFAHGPRSNHDSNGAKALKKVEADFANDDKDHHSNIGRNENDFEPALQSANVVSDLFSEVHIAEIRKLETLLEQAELEKSNIQLALDTAKRSLETTQAELQAQRDHITEVKSQMMDLTMCESMICDDGNLPTDAEESAPEIKRMKLMLQHQAEKYSGAMKQVHNLEEQLKKLMEEQVTGEKLKKEWNAAKEEAARLQEGIAKYEDTVGKLESELINVSLSIGSSQNVLTATQEDLTVVSEEIAKLYYLMCEVNGNTPNRVMLEHAEGRRFARQSSPKESDGASERSGSERDEKSPLRELPPESPGVDGGIEPPVSCRKLLDTVHDQIKYLRREVEKSVDARRQKQLEAQAGEDVADLQQQILKLKAMLATKREQIATLRSVLKANKAVAEKALANLKQKYETEKVLVAETLQKLRNELKGLKEDAATFASLRAMFAKRCDEYVTQLNELQKQLTAAEDEKKTLNALLRMAIQQKIALTQKLEDMEFDRERRNYRQRHNAPGSAGSSRGKSGAKVSDTKQSSMHEEPGGFFSARRHRRDF